MPVTPVTRGPVGLRSSPPFARRILVGPPSLQEFLEGRDASLASEGRRVLLVGAVLNDAYAREATAG